MTFTLFAFGRIVADTSWDVSPRNFIVTAAIAVAFWIAFLVSLIRTRPRTLLATFGATFSALKIVAPGSGSPMALKRCEYLRQDREELLCSRPGRIEASTWRWSGSSSIGFDSQSVVDGNSELLLASEVALGRLNGDVAEQNWIWSSSPPARWQRGRRCAADRAEPACRSRREPPRRGQHPRAPWATCRRPKHARPC